jgi:uncharacterized protein (TIGR03437 family)
MRFTYSIALVLAATALAMAQSPVINQDGIVNGANFQASEPIAPGSLISIFGTGLASATASADTIPLSTTLGQASVTFSGSSGTYSAPLLFADSTQLNVQVPWETLSPGANSDTLNVTVTVNGTTSPAVQVNVGTMSPGIFQLSGRGLIVNYLDNTFAWPTGAIAGLNTHPAAPGDFVIMYTTGLGPVASPPQDGSNSSDELRNTLTKPVVTIGGVNATVDFSGLSPLYVGVYQLNVQVPTGVTPGDAVPVVIQLGGITTPGTLSTMAVSQ